MYALTGITGHVGGAAARELLAQGKKIRALVRDLNKASHWAEQGVELRQGDWNDVDALASVLEGAEGAYLMMPPSAWTPGFPEAKAMVASYRKALDQAKPGKAVFLSSIGSEQPDKLGLITSTRLLEQGMADLPLPKAFIRAGSFFENYVPLVQRAGSTGVLHSFYAPVDRQVPMIATVDIGKEVAKLLTSEWTGTRIVELGSAVSPDELAQAGGDVLGRSVTAQAIPRDQWPTVIEAFGVPKGSVWAYEEMCDSFNSGWIAFGVPGTEKVPGTTTARQVFAAALGK